MQLKEKNKTLFYHFITPDDMKDMLPSKIIHEVAALNLI